MGAWGAAPFENDDAADWISEALHTESWNTVSEALTRATENEDYLEAPDASIAVAAAAIVAAATPGNAPWSLVPGEIESWALGHAPPDASTRERARLALERVMRDSELRELWQKSLELDVWLSAGNEIKRRLTSN